MNKVKDYTDDEILKLLGRTPVRANLKPLMRFYRGKTILVTGGAGSIGTEIVRTLTILGVKQIIVFDWWENGVFYLQHEIESPLLDCIIGDVKTPKIDKVIAKYKPEVVIHAAAYKHCPLMNSNPIEAFNNNVWGILNTMEAASKNRV